MFAIISCKKEDTTPPVETCKLTNIDRGNGNKHTYTYDATGRISTMIREFDGTGSGTISKYVYAFTYDGAGLLTKSTYTLDGKAGGIETYTYTNGKITKVNFTDTEGTKGVNNVKYDAASRIIEFTSETGNPDNDAKAYYEFDANGIITKRGYADLQGNKFFEVVIKPVGVAKSPEQLLAKYGLPYDLLNGFSWQAAEGKEGTVSEVFFADANGKLVSDSKDKITAVKTNTKGYITESTSVDDANKSSTQRFTMADCQ